MWDFLLGFVERSRDAIIASIIAAINFLFAFDVALVNALNGAFSSIHKRFQSLFKGLRHVLSDIVHLRFVHLWCDYLRLIKRLREWYEKHFKWLIDLRKRYDEWFNSTIKPILNFLQRIRRVLAIFRIFHLKFAEKLDALIGRLESRIIRNTLALRQKINEIATIIDLVLDPSLVIRNVPLLRSIWFALDDILKIFFGLSLRKLFGPGSPSEVNPLTGLLSKDDIRGLQRAGFDTSTAFGQAGAEGFALYQEILKRSREG